MKPPRTGDFEERRKTSNEAKKRLLEKFKVAPKFDDPASIAKRDARAAAAELRADQRASHAREKAQEAADLKARSDAENAANAASKADNEAKSKAERDRRYAARKARN